jgi:predicted kinase
MRGLPGSGKSTTAKRILNKFRGIYGSIVCKCSADDYFTDDHGNYNFDATKLGRAHGACQTKAKVAMEEGISLVVVDNTNTMKKEMNPYLKVAKKQGYKVRIIMVGGTEEEDIKLYTSRNVHGVPEEAIRRMAGRIKESLK